MIFGILIWLLTLFASYLIIGSLRQKYKAVEWNFLIGLFYYHTALALAYYFYAAFNASDSINYFAKAQFKIFGDDWFAYYGISTKFIDFISFGLVNYLGFTYEACMAFFAWLGYLGFVYFYIFFTEHIKSNPKIFGYNLLKVIFLLPNLHFWSSSLGKGSIIFFGFGLIFFALTTPLPRLWALVLGGYVVFQIRPHIFYVILIAVAVAYTFSIRGVNIGYRLLTLALALVLLYYINDDILTLTGLDDESIFQGTISHRAGELSKATSGIDLAGYNIFEKLFAFWFRPLFFDAPGALGLIVSFENLFYLILFLSIFRPKGLAFLWKADAFTKTCLLTFLGVSFALAQISGNLGLAMRQKSQVMILMMFVIARFFDEQKIVQIRNSVLRKIRLQKIIAARKTRTIIP